MPTGSGRAKVILLGEHFILYELPAIVAGLPLLLEVNIEQSSEILIESDQTAEPNQIHQIQAAVDLISAGLNLGNPPYHVRIRSQIPLGANLGSSAALCIALVRALAPQSRFSQDPARLLALATEAEGVFHGRSSGIDVTTSALGGIHWFEFDSGARQRFEFQLPEPLFLVIMRSDTSAQTEAMVTRVRDFSEHHPARFQSICRQYRLLAAEAKVALAQHNIPALGKAMQGDHVLLRHLGLSTPTLDEYCAIANRSGASGAKLTGSGGGGSAVALAVSEERQTEIARQAKQAGAEVFPITLNSPH